MIQTKHRTTTATHHQGTQLSTKNSAKFRMPFPEISHFKTEEESCAVARKLRDTAAVLFGLKFADDIHHNFKSAGIAKLQRPGFRAPNIPAQKQNLTQNGHSRLFKVTCFGISRSCSKNCPNSTAHYE